MIAQAKYVHFMTHTHNINGFLGLSYGTSYQEDGLLTGPEIATKLSINADTVLVTACDTAGSSQQLLPGEAFSSLAVGFVMAGAKRLLITLWPVTDEVAGHFAAIYLKHRNNGYSKHAALHKTRQVLKEKYPPYYWGGFILMGD
jgi:CHAT domain-containing protein